MSLESTSEPSQARPSSPNDFRPPTERAVGTLALLSVLAALVASLPSALRTSGAGGSAAGALVVGIAVLGPVALLLSLLGRGAARGLRMLTGRSDVAPLAAWLALWLGLSAPLLQLFATVLKSSTNHRGLGGATFGVSALVLVLVVAVVARRLVRTMRSLALRGVAPTWLAAGVAVLAVAPSLFVTAPVLGRAFSTDRASDLGKLVLATLLDGVLLGVCVALVGTTSHGLSRLGAVSRHAGRVAAALVVAGGLVLFVSPQLAGSIRKGGGLTSVILSAFERLTDHDRDGHGSHFGGSDCDEGDARRFPSARDERGDGIDQDCDGVDGVAQIALDAEALRPAVEVASAAHEARGAATVASSSSGTASIASKQPSIVLVTLDSVRADRTSAYGYEKNTTPNLAALASRGALFERAYAPASDTQRTLVPFFSGARWSRTLRVGREWPRLAAASDTLAERMSRAGYATAGVSSFTWLSSEKGFSQGFDRFVEVFRDAHPERGTTGPLSIRAARAELVRAESDSRPLFLWVHLFDAHEQHLRRDGFDFGRGRSGTYDGEVAFVDAQLGELVRAVGESRRASDVVFVVVGTRGESLGGHDSRSSGAALYDEDVRVPFVVAAPGLEGKRVGGLASTLDVVPTLLALAGAPHADLEGASLADHLGGSSANIAPERQLVLRGARMGAVVEGNLKLVVRLRRGKPRLHLFDLASDPREERDVGAQRPDDLARLEAAFSAFETSTGTDGESSERAGRGASRRPASGSSRR